MSYRNESPRQLARGRVGWFVGTALLALTTALGLAWWGLSGSETPATPATIASITPTTVATPPLLTADEAARLRTALVNVRADVESATDRLRQRAATVLRVTLAESRWAAEVKRFRAAVAAVRADVESAADHFGERAATVVRATLAESRRAAEAKAEAERFRAAVAATLAAADRAGQQVERWHARAREVVWHGMALARFGRELAHGVQTLLIDARVRWIADFAPADGEQPSVARAVAIRLAPVGVPDTEGWKTAIQKAWDKPTANPTVKMAKKELTDAGIEFTTANITFDAETLTLTWKVKLPEGVTEEKTKALLLPIIKAAMEELVLESETQTKVSNNFAVKKVEATGQKPKDPVPPGAWEGVPCLPTPALPFLPACCQLAPACAPALPTCGQPAPTCGPQQKTVVGQLFPFGLLQRLRLSCR